MSFKSPTTVPTVISKSARAKAKEEEFFYVLRDVVGLDNNDVLIHALGFHGTSSMADLLAMTNKDIGKLSFIGDDGKDKTILRAKTNIIRILQAFNFHLVKTHCVKRINWKGDSYASEDKLTTTACQNATPMRLGLRLAPLWQRRLVLCPPTVRLLLRITLLGALLVSPRRASNGTSPITGSLRMRDIGMSGGEQP